MITEDRRTNMATGILLALLKTRATIDNSEYITNEEAQRFCDNQLVIQAVRITDKLIKELEII